MNRPLDEAALVAILRPYLSDEVPPEVVAAANEALQWSDPDAALATLIDGVGAGTVQAGVRGPAPGVFTFAAGDVTIEVEASRAGDELRLAGQITPPSRGRVRVDQSGGGTVVAADEWGRFSAEGLRPQAWRLAVFGAAAQPIHTEWVL